MTLPPLQAVPLPDRALLRLAGPDARGFLQGLVSNDVDLVAPDRAVWTGLLTPQGKYLFDFIIHDAGLGLVLDVEAARAEELARRLAMYRLRAQVEIAPAIGVVAAVLGTGAAAALGLPERAGAAAHRGPLLVAVDPRDAALGVRVLGPPAAVAGGLAGVAAGSPASYERLRLARAVPDGTRDLEVGKSLLLECNFEELNGLSFTKGCFIGQELTARTKHRALVRRRLLPVQVAGPLPVPGTVVTAAGTEAGVVASGAGDLALALLRLEHLAAELRAGEARLSPLPPPWQRAAQPAG